MAGLGAAIPLLSNFDPGASSPPTVEAEAADVFRVILAAGVVKANPAVLSDTIAHTVTLSAQDVKVISDVMHLAHDVVGASILGITQLDSLSVRSATLIAYIVACSDDVTTATVVDAIRAAQVIEALGVGEACAVTALLGQIITSGVRVGDTLTRFFGADALDVVEVAASWAVQGRTTVEAQEALGVAGTLTPQFYLRVIAQDTVAIDPTLLLQGVYTGTISEIVELSAAYLSPGGTFTAWAMNTRTGAVTEYDNFEFNSFASMGNKYIAASGSGLYELNGDTDAGADIIARLKSGYMQFGGTKLSRLKSAYIATRGGGDFVLKIETGDGATYTYAVDSRNMRSSKVHMGKGQRARYFSFELTSTGQDFDLDTLEFVPVVVERRV